MARTRAMVPVTPDESRRKTTPRVTPRHPRASRRRFVRVAQ